MILGVVWGGVWATWLHLHPTGKWMRRKRTWLTVVVGVGVDFFIAFCFVPWECFWPVAAIVGLSGIPIIAWCLGNEQREDEELIDGISEAQSARDDP
jgi:hypothetical protein